MQEFVEGLKNLGVALWRMILLGLGHGGLERDAEKEEVTLVEKGDVQVGEAEL